MEVTLNILDSLIQNFVKSVKPSKEDLPSLEFKLVILGTRGVGKTALINRFQISDAQKKYNETTKATIHTIEINTSTALFKLHVWDTLFEYDEETGDVKANESLEPVLVGASGVILMFDLTNRMSYKLIPSFYNKVLKILEDVRIVLVGNKADVKDRKIKPRQITYHRKKNLNYHDVSALSNYNVEKPFLSLIRGIVGDSSVEIKAEIPLNVPTLMMSPEAMQISAQIDEMDKLPHEDDDF